MILKAFAIYDSKALCYGVPFFMASVGSAVRAFGDLANDRQSTVSKHPSDYVLYGIGEYDDNTGLMAHSVPYQNLGIGADFIGVSSNGADKEVACNP